MTGAVTVAAMLAVRRGFSMAFMVAVVAAVFGTIVMGVAKAEFNSYMVVAGFVQQVSIRSGDRRLQSNQRDQHI